MKDYVQSQSGILIPKPEPLVKPQTIEVVRELTPEVLKQVQNDRKKAA